MNDKIQRQYTDRVQPQYTEEQLKYSKIETKSGQTFSLKFRKGEILNKELKELKAQGVDIKKTLMNANKEEDIDLSMPLIYVGSMLPKQGVSYEEYVEYTDNKTLAWQIGFIEANAEFVNNLMSLVGF